MKKLFFRIYLLFHFSTFKILLSRWKQQWEIEKSEWKLLKIRKSECAAVKQHAAFHKIESMMITQIKTDRIDLTAFLNKMWVFEIEFSVCQCDWARKTAAHVIEHCFCFAGIRHQIADSHTDWVNIRSLISSSEEICKLVKWFIQLQILLQFNLTEKLLYESEKS